MLSKAIPRRSRVFEPRITENPKFQAPIPLYPEPDTVDGEADKVKVKLRRNPSQSTSAVYEKIYTPWTGHTTEGYCYFRAMLDEYTKQAPLNNVVERVGAVSLLLSGTLLSNWQNVVDKLPAGNIWSKETFEHCFRA
jgi:hypothetical protein